MRICVVSTGDASRDPRLVPLVSSLSAPGNDVVVVTGPNREPVENIERVVVPARLPAEPGRMANLARRAQPGRFRRWSFARRIASAAADTGAELLYPLAARDLATAAAAAGSGGAVFSPPRWGSAGVRDIAILAPHDPRWSTSPAGPGLDHHLQVSSATGAAPRPGRHAGRRIAIAYRDTPTTPGRYLRVALERAGIGVDFHDGVIDFGRIDDGVDAAVVVESPYPALEVSGEKSGVPLLFWVHHGEHHLEANVRLADRYRADAILLAHSWHLAHRFPAPVHRFPFGAALELSAEGLPYSQRPLDVAMVGAGLTGNGGTYTVRARRARALEADFGDGARFDYGLMPERVAELYRSSRVVLNDGGSSHRPITMRVFEATGNGATLLTEAAPGLDVILPEEHYRVVGDDVVADVRAITTGDRSAALAAEAFRYVMGHHSYDHRVDELLEIAAATPVREARPAAAWSSELAQRIDQDVEVQTILDLSSAGLAGALAGREIRSGFADSARPGIVDAVAIGPDLSMAAATSAARLYIYLDRAPQNAIDAIVADHPGASVDRAGTVTRIDLHQGRYRQRSTEHPLA
jgi:Glycosyl transferases group 1